MSSAGNGFGGVAQGLRYYEFQLDSYDAFQPADNQYSKLDIPLFYVGGKKPLVDIAAVKALEVQVPFTYYVFNEDNNSFILNEDGYPSQTVTIPEGNYTVNQLLSTLTALMQPSGIGCHWTYTITYSSITQKLTFATNNTGGGATTSPFSLEFGLVGDRGFTNPRLWLGFNAGVNQSQTFSTSTGDVLVAPNVINLSGPNYLYLCSNRFGNLVNNYLPTGSAAGGNSGPQITKIGVNANPGGVITFVDPDNGKYFDLENLQSLYELDFYFTAGSNPAPLKLNGASFSIKLALLLREYDGSGVNTSSNQTTRVLKKLKLV